MQKQTTARIPLLLAILALIFTLPATTSAQQSQDPNTSWEQEVEIPEKRDFIAGPVVCMALRCPDPGEPIGFPDVDEQKGDNPDLQDRASYIADPPPKDPDDISDDPRF